MKRLKCDIKEDEKVCRFEAVADTEEEAVKKLHRHKSKEHS